MEKPVIFLQSLLVLVVTIQEISACKCGKPRTMMEAICANETLVMAAPMAKALLDRKGNPVHDPYNAFYTNYTMYLNAIYHEGREKFQKNPKFTLITPLRDCGVVLELNNEYLITGMVGAGNSLFVRSCDLAERVPWDESSFEEIEIMNDLLTRQSAAKCGHCATNDASGKLIFC